MKKIIDHIIGLGSFLAILIIFFLLMILFERPSGRSNMCDELTQEQCNYLTEEQEAYYRDAPTNRYE